MIRNDEMTFVYGSPLPQNLRFLCTAMFTKYPWSSIPHALWGWLIGGLMFRGIVAWLLPVGFDEGYYYAYSRHLNWSYFDHPPVIALTTGLGWWLTHHITPFTTRVGALGLYTLCLLAFYLTAKRLFNPQTGLIAVAIASISPLLWLTFGVLTSPDNGLILFWTLTLLIAVYEFFPPQEAVRAALTPPRYRPSVRIVLLGLTLGLACLSKYHGFILGLGLVGFCLTSDRVRKALWSPWTGFSLLVFLLTLMPLWFWNSQNEWISFRFHLFLRFDGGEPSLYRFRDAVGTWLLGILYLFPTIGFPLWWATGRALIEQFRRSPVFFLRVSSKATVGRSPQQQIVRERTAFILWISLPIALGFTLLGGKQNIYPAWPAPGFWGLTLLLAHGVTHWHYRRIKRWLGGTTLAVGTLIFLALLHLSLGILQQPGNYSPLGGVVPVEQDGSTALLDVMQLRSQVAESPGLSQILQQTDFIFTDEFYLSAYIDMALHPLTTRPITCLSQDPRGYAFWYPSDQWVGQKAIYVTLASLHADRALLASEFQPYFRDLTPLIDIPLQRGGVVTETLLFYQTTAMEQSYLYPYP